MKSRSQVLDFNYRHFSFILRHRFLTFSGLVVLFRYFLADGDKGSFKLIFFNNFYTFRKRNVQSAVEDSRRQYFSNCGGNISINADVKILHAMNCMEN